MFLFGWTESFRDRCHGRGVTCQWRALRWDDCSSNSSSVVVLVQESHHLTLQFWVIMTCCWRRFLRQRMSGNVLFVSPYSWMKTSQSCLLFLNEQEAPSKHTLKMNQRRREEMRSTVSLVLTLSLLETAFFSRLYGSSPSSETEFIHENEDESKKRGRKERDSFLLNFSSTEPKHSLLANEGVTFLEP